MPSPRPIPDACVERLSLYVRQLARLHRRGVPYISSRGLADHVGVSDAQVRRDLSYFGQFGTSGRGYAVERLQTSLDQILGIQGHTWYVALAGVGNLGSALMAYRGFQERGFVFRVAVDASPEKIGQTVQGVVVQPSRQLVELVRQQHIHIGLIAVPSDAAQAVCDQFVEGGVRAIVNFAPSRLEVPAEVRLRTIDLAIELETLAFHLGRSNASAKTGSQNHHG